MIELAVGTRFYYKGELCEVSDEECRHCRNCVNDNDVASCRLFACEQRERKDKTGVFFKRVNNLQLKQKAFLLRSCKKFKGLT